MKDKYDRMMGKPRNFNNTEKYISKKYWPKENYIIFIKNEIYKINKYVSIIIFINKNKN